MTNRYSLADLKADLDKQYAPLVLELGDGEVTLRNVLRMPEKERKRVFELMDELDVDQENPNAEDADKALVTAKDIIVVVVADGKGQALADLIGDDLALAMRIFELWMEATQPGEAEDSPDSSTSTASA